MDIWFNDLFQPHFMVRFGHYLPVFIFIVCFLEVVVPPIPGDTLLIFGSSIGVVTGVDPVWLVLSAFAGTYAASLLIYRIGAKMGMRIIGSPRYAWLLDTATFSKIKRWFERYGYWTLLVSRLLPIARSGVALTAGIVNFPPIKVMIALAVSVAVSATLFVSAGLLLGERWSELYRIWHSRWNRIVWIGGGLLLGGFLLYRFFKLSNAKRLANSRKK
jgi:membrane protein DedA with SNARE-associated domain